MTELRQADGYAAILALLRYKFDDAVEAFEAMKAGKGKDGRGVIKAIINGPE